MNCNIVNDLLPLYYDGLCSEETMRQLEEHIENCPSCKSLANTIIADLEPVDEVQDEIIKPFKKVKRKLRRKNILIFGTVSLLVIFCALVAVLICGQFQKKGISFEYIYDAVRMNKAGKEFAKGNINPLYDMISNDFVQVNDESAMLHLSYDDPETYQADMKETIQKKYDQYFEGKHLKYRGIYEIGYKEFMKGDWSRTLTITLQFSADDNIEYYINFYKASDGKYLADDYFGEAEVSYTAGDAGEKETEQKQSQSAATPYQTYDSLFACLSNKLSDNNLSIIRSVIKLFGERRLQGEEGEFTYSVPVISENDMKNGTNDFQNELQHRFERIQKRNYCFSDVNFIVENYDKNTHLFRYLVSHEFTGKEDGSKFYLTLEGYRIADKIVYIPDTMQEYDGGLPEGLKKEIIDIYEGK